MKKIPIKSQKGQTLVILLTLMVIVIVITSASVIVTTLNARATDTLYEGATAHDVAESGAETAMVKLLRDPNYSGETTPMGGGQAVITVTGTNPKTVISKGSIGNFTRKIQVVADYTNNVLTVTSWNEIN